MNRTEFVQETAMLHAFNRGRSTPNNEDLEAAEIITQQHEQKRRDIGLPSIHWFSPSVSLYQEESIE